MNKRLEYIDIVKGIGIFLMVLGHSYSEDNASLIIKWLYSFHMPLFFIVSGVLYGIRYNNSGKIYLNLKKKCLTLLLPYFIWNTAYQLFLVILSVLGGASLFITLKEHLIMVLQLNGSAIWFLPSMFLAVIFFRFLIYKKIHIIYCISLTCIGILFPNMQNVYLECILKAFIGTGFMAIGFYLYNIYNKELPSYLLIIVFIIHTYCTFMNGTVSIANRTFFNPFLYVMDSCLGTLLIFNISMKLTSNSLFIKNIIGLWGKNSIKVLCFHTFLIQIIRLLDYKLLNNILPRFFCFEGIILSFIALSILTLSMPLINKFFNWSFGIFDN